MAMMMMMMMMKCTEFWHPCVGFDEDRCSGNLSDVLLAIDLTTLVLDMSAAFESLTRWTREVTADAVVGVAAQIFYSNNINLFSVPSAGVRRPAAITVIYCRVKSTEVCNSGRT